MSAYSDIDQDFGKTVRTANGGHYAFNQVREKSRRSFSTRRLSVIRGAVSKYLRTLRVFRGQVANQKLALLF